jgi:hypothetical protein
MAITVQKNLGFLFLAAWLIFTGIGGLGFYVFPGTFMTVLALLAGILILIGR